MCVFPCEKSNKGLYTYIFHIALEKAKRKKDGVAKKNIPNLETIPYQTIKLTYPLFSPSIDLYSDTNEGAEPEATLPDSSSTDDDSSTTAPEKASSDEVKVLPAITDNSGLVAKALIGVIVLAGLGLYLKRRWSYRGYKELEKDLA